MAPVVPCVTTMRNAVTVPKALIAKSALYMMNDDWNEMMLTAEKSKLKISAFNRKWSK